MAQYTYADPKFKLLAQNLVDADPFTLGHIDVDTIVFLYKEETSPKRVMRISAIREPYIMLTNKLYIIEISEQLVSEISQEHVELHMYKTLKQISPDTGRIIHPDVIEFSDIIDLFGYDWQEKKVLPSILDQLSARTIANTLVKDDEEQQQVI